MTRSVESSAEQTTSSLRRRVGNDLWKFLTSIRLAIALIALIALVGLIGTFFPQVDKTRSVDYIERYGVEGYQWIKALQLDQIFSSTYFIFVMSLFFLNMSACTLKRLKASYRYARLPQAPKLPQAFENMPLHAALEADPHDEVVERALRRRRYRVRRKGDQFLAEKWRWERFGIDVFHVGILVLLIGGLLTATLGYRAFQVAHAGEVFSPSNRDFQVRVDKFWSENYAQTERVMDWHTTLTVLEAGQEVKSQTIEVNAPLYYQGIRFYQSSFGQDWENAALVKIRIEDRNGVSLGEYQAKVDEAFEVAQANLRVKIGAFLPDFALTENQVAYSRTQRLNNPAVYLQVFDLNGTLVHRTWALSQLPQLQDLLSDAAYRFYLIGMTAPEFTGIQVNYDPGLEVALAGFVLMIAGILVHLYFKHRQIWVHVDRDGRRLLLGGRARHASRGFELEFNRLAEQLSKT